MTATRVNSLLIILISFLCTFAIFRNGSYNNVCKSFSDYYTNRDENQNCYHNPDHRLEVPEIIQRFGYKVEIHNITTEDGYDVTLFRIPQPHKGAKPVLLQHGLAANSAPFVNVGKNSLSFVLADAGYDVWMANCRGTKYSKKHREYKHNNPQFWNFTLDDLVNYEVEVQLNFISNVTNKKINYVGFSMGTTLGFMYGSKHPDRASKIIERFVALAPMVYIQNIRLLYILKPIWSFVKPLFLTMGNGEFFLRPDFPNFPWEMMCLQYPIQTRMCLAIDEYFIGSNVNQYNPENLPITFQSNFDTASITVLEHLMQLAIEGRFQSYDYGTEKNTIHYGNPTPPLYNLSQFRVPLFLISAKNDLLSILPNVEQLNSELSEGVVAEDHYVVEDFNHADILSGKDSKRLIFNAIVKFLRKEL